MLPSSFSSNTLLGANAVHMDYLYKEKHKGEKVSQRIW